jgi:hypothetical protein
MIRVRIEAFRAIDNVEKCLEYIEGHRNVLLEHGFSHFSTNNDVWIFDPNIIVIVAYWNSSNLSICGGIRIQVKEESFLPFERVLYSKGIQFCHINEDFRRNCEICGLWNSKKVAGLKISHLLAYSAYSILPSLDVRYCYMFNAKYTFSITQALDFIRLSNLGTINYPNKYFEAFVWRKNNFDGNLLDERIDRNMMDLRTFPLQVRYEQYSKKIIVEYALNQF